MPVRPLGQSQCTCDADRCCHGPWPDGCDFCVRLARQAASCRSGTAQQEDRSPWQSQSTQTALRCQDPFIGVCAQEFAARSKGRSQSAMASSAEATAGPVDIWTPQQVCGVVQPHNPPSCPSVPRRRRRLTPLLRSARQVSSWITGTLHLPEDVAARFTSNAVAGADLAGLSDEDLSVHLELAPLQAGRGGGAGRRQAQVVCREPSAVAAAPSCCCVRPSCRPARYGLASRSWASRRPSQRPLPRPLPPPPPPSRCHPRPLPQPCLLCPPSQLRCPGRQPSPTPEPASSPPTCSGTASFSSALQSSKPCRQAPPASPPCSLPTALLGRSCDADAGAGRLCVAL